MANKRKGTYTRNTRTTLLGASSATEFLIPVSALQQFDRAWQNVLVHARTIQPIASMGKSLGTGISAGGAIRRRGRPPSQQLNVGV